MKQFLEDLPPIHSPSDPKWFWQRIKVNYPSNFNRDFLSTNPKMIKNSPYYDTYLKNNEDHITRSTLSKLTRNEKYRLINRIQCRRESDDMPRFTVEQISSWYYKFIILFISLINYLIFVQLVQVNDMLRIAVEHLNTQHYRKLRYDADLILENLG